MKLNSEKIKSPVTFEPFVITIRVDTPREAKMLKALTNENGSLNEFINKSRYDGGKGNYTQAETDAFGSLWDVINKELKEF